MARRGTFGRIPRAAPSLTNEIIAIAREMNAQRDKNIMDAWENGGLYEGKPVTDDMVKAYWQAKMSKVDKGDPLYDTYQNTYMQLDYTIEESKATTLYSQGKLSDQGMAQFYLNWAKKIPRDSEFYRELQRDGARFMEAAKARARAAADEAKKQAYQDAQANNAKGAAVGEFLTWVLRGVASVNSLIGANDTKGLANLSDPAAFVGIIEQMNANPGAPLFEVDGVTWTANDVFAHLHTLDPSFTPPQWAPDPGATQGGKQITGGRGQTGIYEPSAETVNVGSTFNLDYVQTAWQNQHDSYMTSQKAAAAYGDKSGVAAYEKAAGETSEAVRAVGVWGAAPAYNQIIAQRDAVLGNPYATIEEKYQATQKAGQALLRLSQSSSIDLRTSKVLLEEAKANVGDPSAAGSPTYGEDYLGTKTHGYSEGGARSATSVDPDTGETNPSGANFRVATLAGALAAEHDAIAKDPKGYSYTPGTRDEKTGAFTADPNGKEIGVAPTTDVTGTSRAYATVAVMQGDGSVLMVKVVGQAIHTVAYDSLGNKVGAGISNGTNVQSLDHADVGYSFTYMSGGRQCTLYQLTGADGKPFFTPVSPWGAGSFETRGKDGSITVDLSATVNGKPTWYTSGVYGPGKWQTDVPGAGATQYYNPVASAIDASRDAAGNDTNANFSTALGASIALTDDPKTAATAISRDPRAQEVLAEQTQEMANGDEARAAAIVNENTRILAGGTGINLPPKYNIDDNGNLVTNPNPVMPGVPLPDDESSARVKAAVKTIRDRRFGEDTSNTSMATGAEAANRGQWNSYGPRGTQIKTAGTITVPRMPAGTWVPGGTPKPPAGTPAWERRPDLQPTQIPTPPPVPKTQDETGTAFGIPGGLALGSPTKPKYTGTNTHRAF